MGTSFDAWSADPATSVKNGPGPKAGNQISIGVLAKRGMEQCLKEWEATAHYLEQTIPDHTFIITPLDFKTIKEAVENNSIDFILANPSYYVDLEVSLGVKRIATLNNLHSSGIASTFFAGTIIARKDREDISSISSLRGKTFMAVDPRSLGGWHMTLRELTEEGFDSKNDFGRLLFGGTHDSVVHAVITGQVDAGTVRSDTLERMALEGKIKLNELKIIPTKHVGNEAFPFLHSTRLYPEWPFAKTAHTSEQLAKLVAIALMEMPEDSPAARNARIQGWAIPQNYQPVHNCLQTLRLPPYDKFESLTIANFWLKYKVLLLFASIILVILLGAVVLVRYLLIKLKRARQEHEKRSQEEGFLNSLIEAIPIPIYYKDIHGKYRGINKAFEAFFGASKENIIGRNAFDIHPRSFARIYHTKDEELIAKGGRQRYETQSITPGGMRDIILDKAVFSDQKGAIGGLIGAVLDITKSRRHERLMAARLRLSEFSQNHTIKELLQKVLHETEQLCESTISFFHFVEPDQKTLNLQVWSARTLDNFCSVEIDSRHYPLENAGVWCDCIREKKPIIHSDYNSLPNRKGLPEGHAPLIRELVVPLFRENMIVAILGVGNKEEEYRDEDIEQVSAMADMAWDLVQKKMAEEGREESEERYRTIMEAMEDSIYISSPDYIVEYANPAMIKRVGRDITGEKCFYALYGRESKCVPCIHGQVMKGDFITLEHTDPTTGIVYHVSNAPLYKPDGSISKLAVFRDISDIKKMESQLQQAQKMEAIGTLAGGIAHDFNNILCPMIGYAEILKNDFEQDPMAIESLNQILAAGSRARELIGQILSFSRLKAEEINPLLLQPIVKEILKLLRSSIPASIEIISDIDADCGPVMATATQCHQIIMNLTTNAYHAMENKGGVLKITLRQVGLSWEQELAKTLRPGDYACLSVSDTGSGIDPDIITKIFDPYFTTKGPKKGTGLGLAVAKGIVQSFEGDIFISSSLGKGTEVKVLLPIIDSLVSDTPLDSLTALPEGNERILVIDDEKSVSQMISKMLEQLGYKVSTENEGIKALQLLSDSPDSFDLIITDMIMPGISGIEVAEQVKKLSPGIPIILCTGYMDFYSEEHISNAGIQSIIKKPFKKYEMAVLIRSILDSLN